jgi:hypothetical protein
MDVSKLNQVLKYGRLRPAQDWEPHIDAMYDDRKGKSGYDVEERYKDARNILADKFADEGDPREHILRAVGTPESKEIGQYKVDHWPEGQPKTTQHTVLNDGSVLTLYVQSRNQGGKPESVRLHWFAGRRRSAGFMGFNAHFHPDHARHILSQFHPDDAPGIDKLIALIDKHFPKPEGESGH